MLVLCPSGLRVLPVDKERERRGWEEFIGQDWKGGKSRRAKGVLPEWKWRVYEEEEGVGECWVMQNGGEEGTRQGAGGRNE